MQSIGVSTQTGMKPNKYEGENLRLASGMFNYNRWIFENIKPYLGERVLEVGCGNGNITSFLKDKKLVVGIDMNKNNLKEVKERFSSYKNFIFLKGDVSQKKSVQKLKHYNFDTILCLNLLEHINEDTRCLKELNLVLKDNGTIILLCPSYPSLFGTIDESDNHYRRYSKKDLIKKVNEAGFTIRKVFCMNALGILGWVLHGKILKTKVHIKSHFKILNALSPILMRIEKTLRPPAGLSIIVVGVKNKRFV